MGISMTRFLLTRQQTNSVIILCFLCFVAVALSRLPLPLANYENDVLSRKVFAEVYKLLATAYWCWFTAIALNALFKFASGLRPSDVPIVDPLHRSVVFTYFCISAIWSLLIAASLDDFEPERAGSGNVAFAAVSMVAANLLLVYIGALIDRKVKGWGFWIIACILSGSYLSQVVFGEWPRALETGAAELKHIFLQVLQSAVCLGAFVWVIILVRRNTVEDGRNHLVLIACIASAHYWIYEVAISTIGNSEAFAFEFAENKRLIEISSLVAVATAFLLLFTSFRKLRTGLAIFLSFVITAIVFVFDHVGLTQTIGSLYYTPEYLGLAALSVLATEVYERRKWQQNILDFK